MTHDIMLYNTVLAKRQAVSQITCSPTLDAFDLDYCKILDELAKTDKFVEDRVGICIKELGLAGGIDFNGHYINAFDAYNEAVTYYDMHQRGVPSGTFRRHCHQLLILRRISHIEMVKANK